MVNIASLLEFIIKSLVDKPELVEITQTKQETAITLGIKVGAEDLGRVIGKDGQTIRSLRSLAVALVPEGHEIFVDIIK